MGLFPGGPETTGISELFTFTAQETAVIALTRGEGGKFSRSFSPLSWSTEAGSQEVVVAEWVIRIIAVLLAVS